MRENPVARCLLGLILVSAACAAPSFGAAFSIFEQGTKAMGLAGAFTAKADDPSAMFYNVGGLAFMEKREFLVGATYITSTGNDFTGTEPFPGPDATGSLKDLSEIVPHFYWAQPLTEKLNFGLSINAPFGLVTEWDNPNDWIGRFISTKAELKAIDLGANFGFKLSDNFGIGIGVIGRFSDVQLERRQAAIDPFLLQPAEVAKVVLESDTDSGFGWQIGLLHKVTEKLTWGLSYRSGIDIDYSGSARLTQVATGNPEFDAVVGTVLPFDQDVPVKTGIAFPDAASLGVHYQFSDRWGAEVDANWTGWSRFSEIDLVFPDGRLPDDVIPQNYDDSWHYRLGITMATKPGTEWRFGYVYDQTPQPDETFGPLLPDADRNGVTVGYGRSGGKLSWDFALMYLPLDKRTTTTNQDGFNGTYEGTAWLFGASIGF